ncbi:MAG TPA: hypothetical protein PKA59_03490 [Chakrabartia sp.]|jgi:hypothetical protein|nr:hypothetical protein [Chakrabartia sp.]
MKTWHKLVLLGGAATMAVSAPMAQQATAPKARYAMDVGTVSGMMAMGRGMGGAMSMAFGGGGGNKTAYELHLRLGSSLSPDKGAAKADHFPQPGLKLGKALPLITPERSQPEGVPEGFEAPKGRLLLYWGCGAKAGKGQPVIIDFSKVAKGQFPPGLFSVRVPSDRGPSAANSRTYGEWPNSKGGKPPQSGASLIGEHRVAGNYAPEMKFALTQDFMGALTMRTTSMGGATVLSWNALPVATGYHAWAMGGKVDQQRGSMGDMVWWSSSSAKEFGGGLWDWLSPATVQRLIGEKVVLPPTQTSCAIPAEVRAAAPDFMMANLYAYGPEANFAYPPKPPSGVWTVDWTARVRYRSMTSAMVGGGMGGMMGAGAPQGEPRCKPSVFGAVTGRGC